MNAAHLETADLGALFGICIDTDGAAPATAREFFDRKCPKCGGNGRYGSRGRCFTCNGRGTVPGSAVGMVGFSAEHPAEAAWINANKGANSFAASMADSIANYGHLTPRQLDACTRAAKDAATAAPAPTVETDRLMDAFDKAQANGLQRPKLRFEGFQVSLAPSSGRNAGAIYLKDGETYLGKIQGARYFASRDASPDQQAAIVATMADPLAEAIAFGRRTGRCCVCGRTLENRESVDRGIGPICAEKAF